MGINFVKAKVARIAERPNGDLALRLERQEDGRIIEVAHDLVVLSVGLQPGDDVRRFAPVATDAYGFVSSADPALDVTATDVPGLFAAGTALAPKDIVDTVAEASAVAIRVAQYLRETGSDPVVRREVAHA